LGNGLIGLFGHVPQRYSATRYDPEGRFSPRVGISYLPWKWLALYGNYMESLGSANGLSATEQAFPPQTAT